jgi:hypothetical protein
MITNQWENEYCKTIHIGDNICVFIDKECQLRGQQYSAKINWSAIGSVGIPKTEQFIKDLQEAIKLIKEEKGYNG